jgi:hypothetical protein
MAHQLRLSLDFVCMRAITKPGVGLGGGGYFRSVLRPTSVPANKTLTQVLKDASTTWRLRHNPPPAARASRNESTAISLR